MEADKAARVNEPGANRDQRDLNAKTETETVLEEAQPAGLGARLRQLMEQVRQGEARPNMKRQQLKQNRTKSFLMLAGSMVVMALMFFAIFSSPSVNRRNSMTRPTPNLGRGPAGNNADDGRSVTPLMTADTRNPNENPDKVTPEEVHNTARRQSALAHASPSFGTPPPPPAPNPKPERKDFALNKIDFPEPAPAAPVAATPAPPAQAATSKQEKLTRASLVFVRAAATVARENTPATTVSQPVLLDRGSEFNALPAGTRLVARLQTPVSTAVKAPIVAVIEYNYERDGEIVIPAGTKAFGELEQANDRGFLGIRFHTIQMPDQAEAKIDGRSMSLEFQPLRGQVTGTNAGKRFLVRSLTGVGTIAAATVGVRSGLGVSDTISNNVLLRERVANNMALAGEQQLTELAYHQSIVVTIPGNTRFYIVLAKPTADRSAPAGPMPANNLGVPSLTAASLPSVQELRELMQLKRELTEMYQQQQQKVLAQTTSQVQP